MIRNRYNQTSYSAQDITRHQNANTKVVSRLVTKPTKCAPSEDSDQPGHPSLIRVFAVSQWVAKDSSFPYAHSQDYDQTGRMPRLI